MFGTQRPYLAGIVFSMLVFWVHGFSGISVPSDSRYSIHLAMSLIEEFDTNLDEYAEFVPEDAAYCMYLERGHYYSTYPLGTPLLSAPLVFLLKDFFLADINLTDFMMARHATARMENIIASFYVACSAFMLYAIAYLLGRSVSVAFLLLFIFGFCTSAWSTASRALWQHGPSMLMLSLALYLFISAPGRESRVQFSGIPLALAYIIRPTNSLSVAFLTLYVLIHHRRYFVRYCLWLGAILGLFVLHNLVVHEQILPFYYQPVRLKGESHFLEGIVGILFSPGRGLFVYSPILLFSLYGIFLKIRRKQLAKVDPFLMAIMALHGCVVASFSNWWGGHSYGPRLLSEMIPYLIYFMTPAVEDVVMPTKKKLRFATVAFVLATSFSFYTHFYGANCQGVVLWNMQPTNIDQDRSRLWDWSNPPFLYKLFGGN